MNFGPQQMIAASRRHLSGVGESYGAHFRFAFGVGAMLLAAGAACLIHAILPAVCRDTASRTIRSLARILDDRDALATGVAETAEAVGFALLLALAAAVALGFWLLGAQAVVAVPIALLALALPAAALVANPDLGSLPSERAD